MKKILGLLLTAFLATAGAKAADSVYSFKAQSLDGKMVKLSQYKGKTLLIVNVASKCGNTPQYEGLEKLYDKYKDKNFVVLGFPCNQFGHQEPGTAKEIRAFCDSMYGVKFPLFAKIEVNGPNANPLYKYLKSVFPGDIGWNFAKFLVDPSGKPVKRYDPKTKPDQVEGDVKGLLKL